MPDRLAIQAAIKRATKAAQADMNELDARTLKELEHLYRQAASEIEQQIGNYAGSDGNLALQNLQDMLGQVNAHLQSLSVQRNALLNGSMESAARLGIDPFTPDATGGAAAVIDTAAAMQISHDAVQFVRTFVAKDGLQLSDRIWRIDRGAREKVTNAIEMAVIQGHGAGQAAREFLTQGKQVPIEIQDKLSAANSARVAKDAAEYLLAGQGSPLDNAMRLFRTEMNRAHGTAYMRGAEAHPDAIGTRFLLSPGHPKPDVCNLHAVANLYGLGPGVYPPGKSPWPAHPNTLSYVEVVFKDEVTAADRAGKETPIQALERLSPEQRRGVLGVNKSEAFNEGKITQGMIKSPWKNVKQRIDMQDMATDMRDELTRQYFNGKNISVSGQAVAANFPGMELDREVIPLLAGALDGSRILAKQKAGSLYLEARHELYDRPVTWQVDKDGVLHGIELYLSPDAPKGLGTRMMATSIFTAQTLGLKEIQIMAAGKPDNGYYTWPRLGFDAPLTEADLRQLERDGFKDVKAVLDVMQTSKGRDWWRAHGTRREMIFTLDAAGRSMQTLTKYLKDRGIKL